MSDEHIIKLKLRPCPFCADKIRDLESRLAHAEKAVELLRTHGRAWQQHWSPVALQEWLSSDAERKGGGR